MPLFYLSYRAKRTLVRNLSLLTVRDVSTPLDMTKDIARVLLFDLIYNALLGRSADHFCTSIT